MTTPDAGRPGRVRRWAVSAFLVAAVGAAATGRPSAAVAAPTPAAVRDFSVVVIGDTQFYSASDSRAAIYRSMSRWVVDQQAARDIAFVAHVGDITDSGDQSVQWQRASVAQRILDNGGVPNAVVRGNHDVRPGPILFDQYFPPSRYAARPWYGGYLGDLGDVVADAGLNDRNRDSYQLVTAGGVDLLFVELDVDPSAAQIAWAGRVMDAFPLRWVVLTTHKFLSKTGARFPSGQAIWQGLVYPSKAGTCRKILFVLSGHVPGEGRRSDANACGRSVHQLRSDYQGRPNGGDGWLRILEFQPAAGLVTVRTYSPKLGRYETDPNSQFTVPVGSLS